MFTMNQRGNQASTGKYGWTTTPQIGVRYYPIGFQWYGYLTWSRSNSGFKILEESWRNWDHASGTKTDPKSWKERSAFLASWNWEQSHSQKAQNWRQYLTEGDQSGQIIRERKWPNGYRAEGWGLWCVRVQTWSCGVQTAVRLQPLTADTRRVYL